MHVFRVSKVGVVASTIHINSIVIVQSHEVNYCEVV